MSQEINNHEQMLRDARALGVMLRDQLNSRGAAVMIQDSDGIYRPRETPAVSMHDISLKDLGRQTYSY